MLELKTINYDFSEILVCFRRARELGTFTSADLNVLKRELNRFFKDSTCKEVLFTNNTDNMFFGMKIIALINADDIYDYLVDEEPRRIGKYIVEIDSHLLDPILDLYPNELLAILLHEVGHLVGDTTPIENARNALSAYLAANRDQIKVQSIIHYKEILAYGLKDYLSKTQSMFYTSDESEIFADEFAIAYGLIDSLESAYKKIVKKNIKLYENSEVSKFIVFSWALSVYKNIKIRRVGALRTLARAKQLTGSRLEKMEIDNVIRRIRRIDDDFVNEAAESSAGIRAKIRARMKKARINNLRIIDSTFYELSMQVRNVEDENDALYLMRQINNNLSILEEYINSPDITPTEAESWNKVIDKFKKLRDKLSDTVVYKNKTYGLFVNYPEIVENRY